jgi:serine protease AprX
MYRLNCWCLFVSAFVAFMLMNGVFAGENAPSPRLSQAVESGAVDPSGASEGQKIHPALSQRLEETAEPVKTWVFFTDKGVDSAEDYAAAIAEVAANYNPRAVERRRLRGVNASKGGPLFGVWDLPVVDSYVRAVAATGAEVHVVSRWVNAVSVWATRQQVDQIALLPFVAKLQPVARSRPVEIMNVTDIGPGPFPSRETGGTRDIDYGASTAQLNQINLLALHAAGFTGEGVIIGILDTGFKRSHEAFNNPDHPLSVIAEYDFVDDDPDTSPELGDPYSQHNHGTMILGCLGAYMPGELVGGAYDASFVLAKTEDTTAEYPAEEDNFVAGLEFIEANGADMETSSLGYIDWYTQDDLDGQTAVTTIAVNISTSLGVHHCNAAGNNYHDSDPSTSSLIAPSDAFQCIACGAVDSSGYIAYFSSDGPSADGRVKPEVLARGVSTHTVSPTGDTSYTTADGTSLSTPLVACAVGCLIDARPNWSVDKMRENLFETADYFVTHGTFDPLYIRGYGVIDAFAAYSLCPDAGVLTLDRDFYGCTSEVFITVADCGLNTDDDVAESVTVDIDSDSESGVEQVVLWETDPSSAEFAGSILLGAVDETGVLWVAPGDGITVTYIDADDGAGGVDVQVIAAAIVQDCTPPVISSVDVTEHQPHSVKVLFETSEPAIGTVRYGTSCEDLNTAVAETDHGSSHEVMLESLDDSSEYFFQVEATDQFDNTAVDDNGGNCYSFHTPFVVIEDDFETDQGWTVENISLADGAWERDVPIGGGVRGDPPTDYDGSGQCYLTANREGNSDVDGGPTRLISPLLDLYDTTDPMLGYARWWTNDDHDADVLEVEISNDDGSTWVLIESVPDTVGWVERTIRISDFLAPTSQVKVRFSARDFPNNSIDEGGVDFFRVTSFDLGSTGDFDFDEDVDLEDFAAFARCYGNPADGPCGAGNMAGGETIDLDDYAMFYGAMTGPQ